MEMMVSCELAKRDRTNSLRELFSMLAKRLCACIKSLLTSLLFVAVVQEMIF